MGSGDPSAPMAISRSACFAMLFTPLDIGRVRLRNRLVMAPMTRAFAPGGVPGAPNADYYERRAVGGIGLLISEGTLIDHDVAGNLRDVPVLEGEAALKGWRHVLERVHAAGAAMFAQLWHVGMQRDAKVVQATGLLSASPSGHQVEGRPVSAAMTARDIDNAIDAYARAAANARDAGFDGIELHGAHGYLIDQFFWEGTNRRTDAYGGDMKRRTRFACDAVAEIKRRLGADFPVGIRLSQWKQQDYSAVLARTPEEWQQFLALLVDAGVDVFHISTRRYADPAFADSDVTLAALTRKMTGRVVITVGSIGLSKSKEPGWERGTDWAIAPEPNLEDVERRLQLGEFDLVAVGRALLANPDWARLVEQGRFSEMKPYTLEARNTLR